MASNAGNDTICAVATPSGRGGIGVIRLSGPNSAAIAEQIATPLANPRQAAFRHFRSAAGESIDSGLLLYFPGPNSFTGEDVVELQGHGGPVVLDMLMARLIELGARPARPGEFSERAFLNDKLDLAQAEAIADLIDASSSAAAKAAQQSLQGEFSQRVNALLTELIQLRVHVEAAIDFPEEEIDFLADGQILSKLERCQTTLAALLRSAQQGRVLRDGLTIVLVGRPNAGKSSLLNALAGYDAAIVTDIAGTTRDVLRERVDINGMPLHLIDTAGLRDASDAIEAEGIRRAIVELEQADMALLLVDDTDIGEEALSQIPKQLPLLTVRNKIDLSGRMAGRQDSENGLSVAISAKTGEGMETLREQLCLMAGYQPESAGVFSARRRHISALEAVQQSLNRAHEQLTVFQAGELVAEELTVAQEQLGEITGSFNADALLGEIFSNFCIGK